jgi:hypothetical protein
MTVYAGEVRGLLIVMVVVAGVGPAMAQPDSLMPRDNDRAEADRLFEEGRGLMEQGKRADACKLFELSFRKDPRAVGTMLNLGLCKEMTGQIATAVRYYEEARDRAHDQKLREHQDAAERKLALLSPRVPHLRIENAPDGARVIVNDVVLTRDQWTDVTVDPGTRTIVVTAPGKLPYETRIELKESDHSKVVIPPLEGPTTVVIESNRRMWGKITVGTGGVLGLAAIGLSLAANHLYAAQFPSSPVLRDQAHDCWTTVAGDKQCDQTGASNVRTARTYGHVATGAAIAGGLALAIGGYLWWTAPSGDEIRVAPAIAGDHVGLVLEGRF